MNLRKLFLFVFFLNFLTGVYGEGIIPAPADSLDPPQGYASGNMGESFYEKATVEILTVAPGANVPDVWGHTAIMVYDPRLERKIVFDYGMFYFGIDFGWNYIMGVPTYWLGVRTLEDTLAYFSSERRPILSQKLSLTPAQKMKFLDTLYFNARPDKRNYHYHHFHDNCTTRVRDLLDVTLEGALRRETESENTGVTFRSRSMEMVNDPFSWIGMNLMLNISADKKMNGWENMFLPDEFMRRMERSPLSKGDQPVIGPVTELLKVENPVAAEAGHGSFIYFAVFLVIYILLFHLYPVYRDGKAARILDRTGIALWVGFAGSLGLFISVFWAISPREGFSWNWNLLALNPFLIFLPLMLYLAPKYSKAAYYYLIFMTALPAAGFLLHLTGILIQNVTVPALYASVINGLYLFRVKKYVVKKKTE